MRAVAAHISSSHNWVCYFGCLKGASKSVQVLFSGIEMAMVLTLIVLKQRALQNLWMTQR